MIRVAVFFAGGFVTALTVYVAASLTGHPTIQIAAGVAAIGAAAVAGCAYDMHINNHSTEGDTK